MITNEYLFVVGRSVAVTQACCDLRWRVGNVVGCAGMVEAAVDNRVDARGRCAVAAVAECQGG